MAGLAASDVALLSLVVLGQRRAGIRTAEMARLLGVSYTGTQKALETLREEELVARDGHLNVRVASPRAEAALEYALSALQPAEAIRAIAVGSPAVECAAVSGRDVLVVLRRFTAPEDEVPVVESIRRLRRFEPDLAVEIVRKEDVRENAEMAARLRARTEAMRVLFGSIERTFPDRTRHGDVEAPPLGALNPAIRRPSRTRLTRLARRFGIRRIVVFGSAVRTDLRDDSDIDLLVELRPGRTLSVGDRARLTAEAEHLFGRDVDVVIAPVRGTALAARIRRDGVVVHDAAG